MSNALVSLSDIDRMARAVAASGLFGVKSPEQAMALMLVAQAEGRHPATVARDYDIIQGRPSKKSEAMLRDFLDAGGRVEWHALDDNLADATFSHPLGGTVRISWDHKRAAAAGLGGKDMWKKYPRVMLRARVVSEGVRTVCPSATSGMYTPEETRDAAPAKNMGDAEVVPAELPPPAPEPSAELLEQANEAAQCGMSTYAAFWQSIGPEARKLIGASRHADFKSMAAEVVE
jgi:hypothetical protein